MSFDYDHFRDVLLNAGIDTGGELVAGKLTRATCICKPTKKGRDANGWYLYHADEPASVTWGCWNTGCPNHAGGTATSKRDTELTPADREKIKARIEADRKARELERQQVEQTTRAKAAKLWKSAGDVAADHDYVRRKGIRPVGAKQIKDMVLIPMSAADTGEPESLQLIFPDGSKKFLTGTGAIPGPLFHVIDGTDTGPVYVVEGWATGCSVHEATGATVVVAFSSGKLAAVARVLQDRYAGRGIVIAGDTGNGSEKATEAARLIGGKVVFPTMSCGADGTDFNDLHQSAGLEEAARQLVTAISESPVEESPRFKVIDALSFMALRFPPRENILTPWLPQQGLTMLYASRGIGKTHFSLGVAYAVSSGGKFLNWDAPKPRGVLFLDGEMPAASLQERIARIAASNDFEPSAPFRIITPDLQPSGMLDLSRPEDQRTIEPYLDGIDLIIADNLSTLCRNGKENEGEAWLPVQAWALQQRAAGRSVLFIHHAGKNGSQRGSSRREDVLDTVISLQRPGDYTPDQGATFEVHFEKARGIYGEDTKPFEAQLITTPEGLQTWAIKPLEESTVEKVAALLNEGIPQHEIPELLGITKGAVSKAKKKAAALGLYRG